MADVLVFSVAAFFCGILGIITGGPFKIFVIRNEIIESVIARAIVAFVFFPPVVGVVLMISYFFLVKNPELGAFEWGAIIGLISGMTYSYMSIGNNEE